jgi:hypothetical protein
MGGGGKGAKTASAPDYTALAQQQGAINQQTAQQLTAANRPNQYDPFGNSITWSQTQTPQAAEAQRVLDEYKAGAAQRPDWDQGQINEQIAKYQQAVNDAGGAGTWSQQQNLNPETKAAWEEYMRNANQASSSYGGILNNYLSNYKNPELAQYDPNSSDKAVSDALYGSVMDRGRVEQQRESDALTTQLRNSGLQPGSEAYNRAMQNLMTSQNDANLLAAQNATLAGGNEARAQYATQLQGQLAGRNQPLQELAGMAGIAGGTPYTPTYQGFSGATGYNPTDLVGAAQAQYGAKQQGANASNSKKSGLMGAGASLGGSYLGSK